VIAAKNARKCRCQVLLGEKSAGLTRSGHIGLGELNNNQAIRKVTDWGIELSGNRFKWVVVSVEVISQVLVDGFSVFIPIRKDG